MSKKQYTEGHYIVPNRCIDNAPTSQSVLFCNYFINLSTIAKYTKISLSHISLIFSGKRQPSLSSAKKIAIALDMDLHSFVKKLDEHTCRVKPYLTKDSKIEINA